MTQSQNTPGPWVVQGDNIVTDGFTIGGINIDDAEKHPEEAEANLALMASAPDMKAALIDAERWLGFLIAQDLYKDSSSPNHARQTLKRVTDAINKAEGRLAQ